MAVPSVLMYHGFGRRSAREDPHDLFVPVEDFERHLRFLCRYLRPVDLDGFLAERRGGRGPSRSVLITIDDGYRSTLEEAAPRLVRHGVPALLFVPPACLGNVSSWTEGSPGEPLLTAEEVREVRRYGIEVGVHGMDHTRLPGLSSEELRRQVVESRESLADLLGTRPRSFAYPEGLWDPPVRMAVADAGYDVAFSIHEDGGRFAVPRRPMDPRDSFAIFVIKTLPGFLRMWKLSSGHRWARRGLARLAGQRRR